MAFPPHFDGKQYFNPGAAQARGLSEVLRWKLTTRAEQSPAFVNDVTPSIPPSRVDGSALRITMVNHATVLIQADGMNLITDPVWSERASPFSFAGPKRRRAPGVRFEDLPPLDAVLLTHNHYDHFDVGTLRRLAERGPLRAVVPSGLRTLAQGLVRGTVDELDWGESAVAGSAQVTAVPAFHFSARSAFDRNRTLWCGYMVRFPTAGLVYFAGDTGYGPHFEWIRTAFGAPRVALLPVGAFLPRWFMGPVHMGPDEAVRAAATIGAGHNIAIHHGTFQLADDALDRAEMLRTLPGGDTIRVLRNGESLELR